MDAVQYENHTKDGYDIEIIWHLQIRSDSGNPFQGIPTVAWKHVGKDGRKYGNVFIIDDFMEWDESGGHVRDDAPDVLELNDGDRKEIRDYLIEDAIKSIKEGRSKSTPFGF